MQRQWQKPQPSSRCGSNKWIHDVRTQSIGGKSKGGQNCLTAQSRMGVNDLLNGLTGHKFF